MCSTAAPDRPTTTRQTTSVTTVGTSVTVRLERPGAQPSVRRRSWALAAVVVGIGAAVVPLPFLAVSPGSVVDVGELVSVEHPEAASDGRFYLTTVRLAPVTLVEALQGWARPEVDVVERGQVSPGRLDPDELRRRNLGQMDASKDQALGVALEALGHDAVSGDGAEVVDLASGGPLDGKVDVGDVIVGLGGAEVTSHHDVLRVLAGLGPGRSVELAVEAPAGGGRRTSVVTLAAGPESADRAYLGVTLATRNPRFDVPVDIDIATDAIGGPSAGLAFTLQVLDALSEGDLTGGLRVAATGSIGLDGSVGPVGGVAQKAAALEHHAIDLFLVPEAELDRAAALVGSGVRVEPVATLDDALRILAGDGRGAPPRRW